MRRSLCCCRKSQVHKTCVTVSAGEHKKAPTSSGAWAADQFPLDAGATRDDALGTRGGSGQLNGKGDVTLVAQDAQLTRAILIIALVRRLCEKIAATPN